MSSREGTREETEGEREPAPPPAGPLPPGRHGIDPEVVARIQRERIMDAMARTAAEEGYLHVSVERVIQRARVSRRTFYEFFRDREDCFLKTYERLVEAVSARIVAAYSDADGPWRKRLRAAAEELLRFLEEEPDLGRVVIVEVFAGGEQAVARRDTNMQAFVAMVDAGRSELPDPDAISPTVAEGIVGGIHEAIYARLVRGKRQQLRELLPQLMCFAVSAYLGRAEGLRELDR